MNSTSTQFVSTRRMGLYDPIHQIGMWEENFKSTCNLSASVSVPLIGEADVKLDNQSEDSSHGMLGIPRNYDQEANKSIEKIQRRLAQNREAARKSRLRKKAYVQQLESSRLKLIKLEQELDRARQQETKLQGSFIGCGLDSDNLALAGSSNSGIATFEMEYGHWVEKQNRQVCELRNALNAHTSDPELRLLVDAIMNHYSDLFRMKSAAAKVDVFYVLFGMWKTTAERFFLWIGGFRPSELLKVIVPLIEPLTEQQRMDVYNLGQSCQQAEDALSQGRDRLQQILAETVAAGQLVDGTYIPQMANAMEKLEALVSFVNQADHLRQETLQQMFRILTIRQAARCLLALGEYFQRLRALSSLWANRPSEPPA